MPPPHQASFRAWFGHMPSSSSAQLASALQTANCTRRHQSRNWPENERQWVNKCFPLHWSIDGDSFRIQFLPPPRSLCVCISGANVRVPILPWENSIRRAVLWWYGGMTSTFFSPPSTEKFSDGSIESNEINGNDTVVRVLVSMEPITRTDVDSRLPMGLDWNMIHCLHLPSSSSLSFSVLILSFAFPIQLPIFRTSVFYDLLSYTFLLFCFLFSFFSVCINPQKQAWWVMCCPKIEFWSVTTVWWGPRRRPPESSVSTTSTTATAYYHHHHRNPRGFSAHKCARVCCPTPKSSVLSWTINRAS